MLDFAPPEPVQLRSTMFVFVHMHKRIPSTMLQAHLSKAKVHSRELRIASAQETALCRLCLCT